MTTLETLMDDVVNAHGLFVEFDARYPRTRSVPSAVWAAYGAYAAAAESFGSFVEYLLFERCVMATVAITVHPTP